MAQINFDNRTPREIDTVKSAISCIPNCIGRDQVSALKLYILVKILMALIPAYADYTLDQWKELLKKWQALSQVEREADELFNLGVFAEAAGVVMDADVNVTMEAAKCYFCIPTETRLNLIAGMEFILLNNLASGLAPQ